VGLIARGVEEAGIPTVYLGSCRDMMKQLMAPRMVFLDFPLGRQCGKPNNIELQMNILKRTFTFLETALEPGLVLDLPFKWDEPFDWDGYHRDVAQMIEEENIPPQNWGIKIKP
jgi:D-proline reductase (dithiol) PrdB